MCRDLEPEVTKRLLPGCEKAPPPITGSPALPMWIHLEVSKDWPEPPGRPDPAALTIGLNVCLLGKAKDVGIQGQQFENGKCNSYLGYRGLSLHQDIVPVSGVVLRHEVNPSRFHKEGSACTGPQRNLKITGGRKHFRLRAQRKEDYVG